MYLYIDKRLRTMYTCHKVVVNEKPSSGKVLVSQNKATVAYFLIIL